MSIRYACEGKRAGHVPVTVNRDGVCYALDPRHDLRNHSPDGFQYGYGGSGPAQLALAILADWFGDDDLARRHYQRLKADVIAKLPQGSAWAIDDEFLAEWFNDITKPVDGARHEH